jgi:hypothetical protein
VWDVTTAGKARQVGALKRGKAALSKAESPEICCQENRKVLLG